MDYSTALSKILSLTNYERLQDRAAGAPRFDLERVESLLKSLEDPHLGPLTLHVAGSKGKGSTSAMLAAALSTAGYRTGLFTSPHLHTFRERVRVDNDMINEDDFAALVERLWPEVERINSRPGHAPLTTFEVLTALAFLYFRQRQVDVQVLEVGLGGRLDATNVVRPTVSVITSISYDHTELLGSTLADIAGEKAGIVKEGVPIVSAPQQPEALDAIQRVCDAKGALLTLVGRDVSWSLAETYKEGQDVIVRGTAMDRPFEHLLHVPLLGRHQAENAAVAVTALEIVRILGHPVPYDGIYRGIAGLHWPGRLERLGEHPTVLVDGAHNTDSAARLREALEEYYTFDKMVLVLGLSLDKDREGIARELAPLTTLAIATRSRNPRAASAEDVRAALQAHGVQASVEPCVATAVDKALAQAGKHDLVLVTGSLFVVAEARERLLDIQAEPYPH